MAWHHHWFLFVFLFVYWNVLSSITILPYYLIQYMSIIYTAIVGDPCHMAACSAGSDNAPALKTIKHVLLFAVLRYRSTALSQWPTVAAAGIWLRWCWQCWLRWWPAVVPCPFPYLPCQDQQPLECPPSGAPRCGAWGEPTTCRLRLAAWPWLSTFAALCRLARCTLAVARCAQTRKTGRPAVALMAVR